MSFILVYVTHPSRPEALRLTSHLLSTHIIACANFVPIESMYWWNESLTSSTEILTIYKTRSENWDTLRTEIESTHIYDTPCIIRLATVDANTSYEQWIHDESRAQP